MPCGYKWILFGGNGDEAPRSSVRGSNQEAPDTRVAFGGSVAPGNHHAADAPPVALVTLMLQTTMLTSQLQAQSEGDRSACRAPSAALIGNPHNVSAGGLWLCFYSCLRRDLFDFCELRLCSASSFSNDMGRCRWRGI
ncbi:hypothetical protein NQZ68_004949 [Dissostichus eleginoides]|nr:hypothetical protein NQZ68_004949 [Dissostichus eleginoides]